DHLARPVEQFSHGDEDGLDAGQCKQTAEAGVLSHQHVKFAQGLAQEYFGIVRVTGHRRGGRTAGEVPATAFQRGTVGGILGRRVGVKKMNNRGSLEQLASESIAQVSVEMLKLQFGGKDAVLCAAHAQHPDISSKLGGLERAPRKAPALSEPPRIIGVEI